MAIGLAGIERESIEAMIVSRLMILKAIPKTSNVEKLRYSSYLYPSRAGQISTSASPAAEASD